MNLLWYERAMPSDREGLLDRVAAGASMGGHRGFDPCALCLPEIGELVRRTGRAAGFIPRSEFHVSPPSGERHWKVDWVWRLPLNGRDGPVVAAFEIEGQDVQIRSFKKDGTEVPGSVKRDIWKLSPSRAQLPLR